MKQKLDSLFWRFAEEKFVYGGVYPYYTELVFAFADYIENVGQHIESIVYLAYSMADEFVKVN